MKTRAAEKVAKTSERTSKKNEIIIKQRQLANELIDAATRSSDMSSWKQFTVKHFAAAFKHLSKDSAQVPIPTKKMN